jgi:hypothetical protein
MRIVHLNYLSSPSFTFYAVTNKYYFAAHYGFSFHLDFYPQRLTGRDNCPIRLGGLFTSPLQATVYVDLNGASKSGRFQPARNRNSGIQIGRPKPMCSETSA